MAKVIELQNAKHVRPVVSTVTYGMLILHTYLISHQFYKDIVKNDTILSDKALQSKQH